MPGITPTGTIPGRVEVDGSVPNELSEAHGKITIQPDLTMLVELSNLGAREWPPLCGRKRCIDAELVQTRGEGKFARVLRKDRQGGYDQARALN